VVSPPAGISDKDFNRLQIGSELIMIPSSFEYTVFDQTSADFMTKTKVAMVVATGADKVLHLAGLLADTAAHTDEDKAIGHQIAADMRTTGSAIKTLRFARDNGLADLAERLHPDDEQWATTNWVDQVLEECCSDLSDADQQLVKRGLRLAVYGLREDPRQRAGLVRQRIVAANLDELLVGTS